MRFFLTTLVFVVLVALAGAGWLFRSELLRAVDYVRGQAPVVSPPYCTAQQLETALPDPVDYTRVYVDPPDYPRRCAGFLPTEHRVTIQFDIQTSGRTENLCVVASDLDCLNGYAARSVATFRYEYTGDPYLAMPHQGARTTFVFILEN